MRRESFRFIYGARLMQKKRGPTVSVCSVIVFQDHTRSSLWVSRKNGEPLCFCSPRHSVRQGPVSALAAPFPGWIFIDVLPRELPGCRCSMWPGGDVSLSLSKTGVHGSCVCVCLHVCLGVVVCESCCTACALVPIKHFAFDALSCGFQAPLVHNPLLHAALAALLKGPENRTENWYNIYNYSCIQRLNSDSLQFS